ncbi:MAG: ABC transporter substrate-binding protein [Alphaproteobacteria bacterium]
MRALLWRLLVMFSALMAMVGATHAGEWDQNVAAARGKTVFLNAWAGSEKINAYIAWAGERLMADYGITLRHVKIDDTATVVSRVLAERAAGKDDDGSVDIVWINGENFAAMKKNGLLFGPFTQELPNFALVDIENKPTVLTDFTLPVEGLEAPWGMAQIVFMYDTARLSAPPRRMVDMLAWAKANPGRLTYPEPPNFTGTTFLKQALHEFVADKSLLLSEVTDADFDRATVALWRWLDDLTPHLWRSGKAYPANREALRQLLDDGEIDIALTFEPAGASSAISQDLLPETVRTYVLDGGTIGNTHFLAIPYNSGASEAAMVAINFLLSAEAQARKQNPDIWGDFTVLDMAKLAPTARGVFDNLPRGIATLSPEALAPTLLEPHPSWVSRLEDAWRERMVRAN